MLCFSTYNILDGYKFFKVGVIMQYNLGECPISPMGVFPEVNLGSGIVTRVKNEFFEDVKDDIFYIL